jgi:hypothetical protein
MATSPKGSEGGNIMNNRLTTRPGDAALDPKKRTDVNARNIEGEVVILDRRNGAIHQLNQTAAFVWDLCNGDTSLEAIAARLTEAFEIDLDAARRDVGTTLDTLNAIGLLEATRRTT